MEIAKFQARGGGQNTKTPEMIDKKFGMGATDY